MPFWSQISLPSPHPKKKSCLADKSLPNWTATNKRDMQSLRPLNECSEMSILSRSVNNAEAAELHHFQFDKLPKLRSCTGGAIVGPISVDLFLSLQIVWIKMACQLRKPFFVKKLAVNGTVRQNPCCFWHYFCFLFLAVVGAWAKRSSEILAPGTFPDLLQLNTQPNSQVRNGMPFFWPIVCKRNDLAKLEAFILLQPSLRKTFGPSVIWQTNRWSHHSRLQGLGHHVEHNGAGWFSSYPFASY